MAFLNADHTLTIKNTESSISSPLPGPPHAIFLSSDQLYRGEGIDDRAFTPRVVTRGY